MTAISVSTRLMRAVGEIFADHEYIIIGPRDGALVVFGGHDSHWLFITLAYGVSDSVPTVLFSPRLLTYVMRAAHRAADTSVDVRDNEVAVTAPSASMTIEATPTTFPKIHNLDDQRLLCAVRAYDLEQLLQVVAVSGSDESRPHLASVHFNSRSDMLYTASTDGHRLACSKRSAEQTDTATALIDNDAARLLARAFRWLLGSGASWITDRPHSTTVLLAQLASLSVERFVDNRKGFSATGAFFSFYATEVEYQFPPVDKVIPRPADATHAILIETEPLRSALKLVADFSPSSTATMRAIAGRGVQVGPTHSPMFFDVKNQPSVIPTSISFSVRYLLDAIAAIESMGYKSAELRLYGPLDAFTIVPADEKADRRDIHVIMPVRP